MIKSQSPRWFHSSEDHNERQKNHPNLIEEKKYLSSFTGRIASVPKK